MERPLRVLIIEDSEDDSQLLLRELRRGGYEVEFERVETAESMYVALTERSWDLILSDYTMPMFSAPQALEVLKASGLDLPFIIISGTISEDMAVTALKAGASDFLIKGKFARLGPAIERELREAESRRERRRAEAALVLNQRRFQALIEHAPDGIALLGMNGKLRQVTPSTQHILGYTLEEAEGQDPALLTHPDDLPMLLRQLNDLIQNPDKIVRAQYRFQHKDGSWRWLESTISNLMTEPSVEAIVFNYRDITERKQAEETLREKERLLSEAQRIGHIGSWSYHIPSDTLLYSDEMYRLFDVFPEEFQHNSEGFLSLIYSSDRPMVAKWMQDIRAGRQAGELEFLIFRKNSELRYIRFRGAVEVDKAGKPARFIGTAQDITERKLAELQIHQQIERLTALRKIDQAITTSFDLNVTLDILLSQVISQLHIDAADVLLLDADEKTLEYAAGKGFRTDAIETARLRIADSQAGRAARERRLIHVENLENKSDDRLLTSLGVTEGFVSYLGVPLIVKRKVKGVLEIFHRAPLQPYPEWLDFLNTLAGQAAIAIEDAQLFENLERSNRELVQAYDATIEGWSRALDLRDKETEGHTRRVTEMMIKLAIAFGLPDERLLHIRWGALLHDIGKMGVPDNILLKPGALTEEEWSRMRTHPEYAYNLLKPIAFLTPALDIPYCHHEKWDGTGYPRGLKGEEIPLAARLFAVVDVWDALCSDRPYRPAWTAEKAREYIDTQAGNYFDPKAVEYFLYVIQ